MISVKYGNHKALKPRQLGSGNHIDKLGVTGSSPVSPTFCNSCRYRSLRIRAERRRRGLVRSTKRYIPFCAFARGQSVPRLNHALPRYSMHRASGQAVVTIGGRDHYLGPFGSDASHCARDRLISQWLADGRQSPQTVETIAYSDHLGADSVVTGRSVRSSHPLGEMVPNVLGIGQLLT